MEKFENLCKFLLDRMKNPIIRVLKDSGISIKDIDKIILIGGSTKSEIVRKYITKLFGKFPYTNINPDESVGIGAGIQTALKLRDEELKEMILTDVCAHTLGIETVSTNHELIINGNFFPIIERNTTIPVSIEKRFYRVYDSQTRIAVKIFQGESNKVKDNLFIGELIVPIEKNEDSIDVRFTYDNNGILEVDVKVVDSTTRRNLIIEESPGTLSKEEIREILKKFENIKIHPKEKSENKYLLEKAKRMYQESLGEKRKHIGYLINSFKLLWKNKNLKK